MTHYVFLILLAFVIAACGVPPTTAVEQASNEAVVGGATGATNTVEAPTATPKSTSTNTPVIILTHVLIHAW